MLLSCSLCFILSVPNVSSHFCACCHMKWKFLVSLETPLCYVMFSWKLSYESTFLLKQTLWEDVLLRTDTWWCTGSSWEKRHMMFC